MLKRTLLLSAACASAMGVAACSGSSTPASAPSGTAAPTPASSSCRSSTSSSASGSGDVLVPGDIPDTQAYIAYPSPSGGYRVSVPEGWGRSQTGTATTFSDKFNAIRVELVATPTAPSIASANATDVPALAASVSCFTAGKVSQVSRQAGPAVLITYRADSAPDAVTGKVVRQDVERYEFWRAGKGEAVITVSSPQGSDNVDPWRKVTDSFTWTP